VSVFELYILTILEYLSIIIIVRKLLNKAPIIKASMEMVAIIVVPVFTEILIGDVNNFISTIINGIILVILIKLLYRKDFIQAGWLYIISFTLFIFLQIIALIPVNIIFESIRFNFVTGLSVQAIVILTCCVIYYFVPINLIYEFVQNKNRIFNMILINSFLLVFVYLFYWYYDISGIIQNILLIISVSSIFVFTNIVTIKNGMVLKQQKEQIYIFKNYLPIVDELINELRAKQHEFDNHIQAISMLADTCKDYDELTYEMKKYSNYIVKDNEISMLLKLNNKILAGFIYSKQKQANEKNLILDIDIDNYFIETKVQDQQLIEIMGTLLDNAFDASGDNNNIKLNINSEDNKLLIEVKNKSPYLDSKTIKRIFNKGFSTKKSDHKKIRGYGLYNLKNIIDNYNGKIYVHNEKDNNNNWVVFKVIV
jgi:signal transduction histidine kinase